MSPIIALAAFGLLTMLLITLEIVYIYITQGFAFGFSSNRPERERTTFGGRVERVYKNQVEASAYVVPILGAAAFLGLASPAVQMASLLIVIGRALFAVLYLTGLPFLRILGFTMASLSSFYLAIIILLDAATT